MDKRLAAPYVFVKNIINKGHERSVKAKKNILISIVLRGIGIAISLLLVPLTIDYIDASRYGIWLTISSIIGWFSFFDIGLTQGLRNKFAEAKAKGDDETAQVYVSTTYAILAIIFFTLWFIFLIVNHFLNWSSILNLQTAIGPEVSLLAIIVFTYFCIQFVLRIVSTIIIADQQPSLASLINVIGQLIALLIIFILVKTTKGSLIKLGITLCFSPIIVLLIANFYFFRGPYKRYQPAWSKIRFSYARGLFNLGVVFFVIQIAAVVQFESANFIIARNFSMVDVTAYNIVYKYFSVINMIFVIFLTPFWSATTEAYFKNEIRWIRNGVRRYNYLNIGLMLLSVIMLIFSHRIYNLWLGKGKVEIGFLLSLWGFIYFNVNVFGSKYVYFLNGISALRIQFFSSIISPVLYVLIAILLIRYFHIGVYALFIASVIANFNGYLLAPLQYYQVIHKNKKGIWVR
jgi:O-antigen/teichoic acid export membrane protein